MTNPGHSKIGASSAERWFACPGSVKLSEGIKGSESEYARIGTAAHHLASFCLEYGYAAKRFVGFHVRPKPGGGEEMVKPDPGMPIAPPADWTLVTAEMATAVQVYLDAVRDIMNAKPSRELDIEVKFHLDNLHEDLWGTADCVIYDPDSHDLWVMDYKHGEGVVVDPEENPQLLYYAVGAAFAKSNRRVDAVHLAIVQPRAMGESVKWWHVDAIDLLDFSDVLMRAVSEVETASQAHPGEPEQWNSFFLKPGDHCRWCPAAAICPKLKETAEVASLDQYKGGKAYDAEDLARSLNQIKALKGWIKALEEFAHSELHRGAVIPDWKLVDKKAIRGWLDEAEAERTLLSDGRTEDEIYEPRKLKSPAQIEELVGKKDFASLVGDFVSAVSSGTTIAPASDKRPAVNRNVADGFEPVIAD